ncbi:MAG: histidine kinase [Bacteroidia bacterium]|nr:histidine kinase [Bacteroidia bacterium]
MIRFLQKRWVYHSLIWTSAYFALILVNFYEEGEIESFFLFIKEPILFLIPIILTTYLAFWAKEKLFDSRSYLLYFLAAAGIVFIGVALNEFLQGFDPVIHITRSQNIANFIFIQIFVLGLQYFKRGIINQYQLQELRFKTAMAELKALKAQINPHFLFNTLNNIYGINQLNPEQGSEMIMELSDVMRYHLEFSKEAKVKLQDEVELLQSYIKLEQLRLRETCELKIDFEEADKSLMISPLLFIPFVENAFKHGTHPTKDCFVHINLSTNPDGLLFRVKNSLIPNQKVVKTNIGLQNTKRRLELLFPEKHKLDIIKKDNYHLVELQIEL